MSAEAERTRDLAADGLHEPQAVALGETGDGRNLLFDDAGRRDPFKLCKEKMNKDGAKAGGPKRT